MRYHMKLMSSVVSVVLLLASIETTAGQTCGTAIGAWLDGPVRALDSRPGLLFASAGPSLRIIDVSHPDQPVELGRIGLPGAIRDLAEDGDVVVAALGRRGVAVTDVSNPRAPSVLARVAVDGFAEQVAADASRVVVAVSDGAEVERWTLSFFDVTSPGEPVFIGDFEHDGDEGWFDKNPPRIALDGRIAYWLGGGRILSINVDHPSGPSLIADRVLEGCGTNICDGFGLSVWDGQVVAAWRWYSSSLTTNGSVLQVYSGGQGGSLSPRGTFSEDGVVWIRMDAAGGLAAVYTGWYPGEVDIFFVGNAAQPMLLSTVASPENGMYRDLEVGDGFLAGSNQDVWLADISDPARPSWTAFYDTAEYAKMIEVRDQHAFLLTSSAIHTLSLEDPIHPSNVARLETDESSLSDSTITDDQLVTCVLGNRLVSYDVSNPLAPHLMASIDVPCDFLAAKGRAVYSLADGGLFDPDSVTVIDYSEPAHPSVVDQFPIQTDANGIYRQGEALVVGTYTGMLVFDITEPLEPRFVATVDQLSGVRSLAFGRSMVYFATYQGITVFDSADWRSLREVGSIPLEHGVRSVHVTDDLLWAHSDFPEWNRGDIYQFTTHNPSSPVFHRGPIGPRGLRQVVDIGRRALIITVTDGVEVMSTRCSAQTFPPSPSQAFVD